MSSARRLSARACRDGCRARCRVCGAVRARRRAIEDVRARRTVLRGLPTHEVLRLRGVRAQVLTVPASVGVALMDSLDELIQNGDMPPALALKILVQVRGGYSSSLCDQLGIRGGRYREQHAQRADSRSVRQGQCDHPRRARTIEVDRSRRAADVQPCRGGPSGAFFDGSTFAARGSCCASLMAGLVKADPRLRSGRSS